MEVTKMNRREFSKQLLTLLAIAGISDFAFPAIEAQTYKEEISSVLISADSKKLVVMTNGFHYIFNTPSTIVQALKGKFHEYLQANFSNFHVAKSGKIAGKVALQLSATAPNDALEDAINAGFIKTPDGAIFNTAIEGVRYRPGAVPTLEKYKLNKTYEIEVTSEQPGDKARITPLQIVGGALAVAGVALFALVIIGNCAVTGKLSNCHE